MSTDDTPRPWRFEDIDGARDHFTPARRQAATPRDLTLDPDDPGEPGEQGEATPGGDAGDNRDTE